MGFALVIIIAPAMALQISQHLWRARAEIQELINCWNIYELNLYHAPARLRPKAGLIQHAQFLIFNPSIISVRVGSFNGFESCL